MAVSLSAIQAGTGAAAGLAGLILASPNPSTTQGYQPLNSTGSNPALTSAFSISTLFSSLPPPLVFNYEGEQVANIESDITDHYVEDNTAIQDQIALKPEIITTKGFIGELNDVVPALLQPLQAVANALTTVSAFTPQLSTTALIQYNQALLAYENLNSIANSATAAWSNLGSLTGNSGSEVGNVGSGVFTAGTGLQSNQQYMFQQLYSYWDSRTLFNIQTPWAIFTNMAIMSVKAVQDAETRVITDFEVTFKKIRTASTLTTSFTAIGRTAAQGAAGVNLGTSAGAPASSSLGTNLAAVN